MDCCDTSGLLPLEVALSRIDAAIKPVADTGIVSLSQALDRVLAEPVIASINVPLTNNSAMDGYAIRCIDYENPETAFRVIGQSFAGHPFVFPLGQTSLGFGEAVRIMTGATIPSGADTVVMQEDISVDQQTLYIHSPVEAGQHIRLAGSDIASGDQVFAIGRRLTALDIGMLASLGIGQIKVYRKLRVAILTTGDELVEAGTPISSGKIYDSNRPMLKALLQRLNITVKDVGIIADDLHSLNTGFMQAADWADVVISTGGVSVGDADYTKVILQTLGRVNFWKVAMKPGKPFAFGEIGKGWFFGLPGNPVSTAITYHQLVVPALRRLAGEIVTQGVKMVALTEHSLKKSKGRIDFQRGHLSLRDGVNRVRSSGSQSSGVLSSMANANCYISLSAGSSSMATGDPVEVIPFDNYIR